MSSKSLAILLAGGSGSRMRGTTQDKCLESLCGLPVIARSARTFCEAGIVNGFVVVCRDDAQQIKIDAALRSFPQPLPLLWARGGRERWNSVLNGLRACPDDTGFVFIHDVARPLVALEALRRLDDQVRRDGAAVLAHRVKDTIKRVPSGIGPGRPGHLENLDRSTLWAMETPQAFQYSLILDAYRFVEITQADVTDDTAAAEMSSHSVSLVENFSPNPKITEPHDLQMMEFLLLSQNSATTYANSHVPALTPRSLESL